MKNLPNFAGVVFYIINFEEVLSVKAHLAEINFISTSCKNLEKKTK